MDKRCSNSIRYTILKQHVEFKCWICKSQETDTAVEHPSIEFNGQSLEIVEKFCYLGDTIRARGDAIDMVLAKTRNGWIKFRDLLPLLATRGLPLGAKCRLYSGCVHIVMLDRSKSESIKEDGMIHLERDDAKIVGWIATLDQKI